MSPEASRAACELQMLEGLVDCAHALGMVLGAAAKAESDTKRCLGLVEAFQKSFLAVRMGIRLCMALRAPPKAAPAVTPERAEGLEGEPLEHEPLERADSLERERERDYEPVSGGMDCAGAFVERLTGAKGPTTKTQKTRKDPDRPRRPGAFPRLSAFSAVLFALNRRCVEGGPALPLGDLRG